MSTIVGFTIDRRQFEQQPGNEGAFPEFSYEDVVRLFAPATDLDTAIGTYHILEFMPACSSHAPGSQTGAALSFRSDAHGPVIIYPCTGSRDCHTPPPPGPRPPPVGPPPPGPHPGPLPGVAPAARTGKLGIRRPVQIERLPSGHRHLVGLPGSKGPIPIFDASAGSDLGAALTTYCRERHCRHPLIFHVYRITNALELPELETRFIAIPIVLVGHFRDHEHPA